MRRAGILRTNICLSVACHGSASSQGIVFREMGWDGDVSVSLAAFGLLFTYTDKAGTQLNWSV